MDEKITAVVEIGSTGIRLLIAEIAGGGLWKALNWASKSVALGRDVFNSGRISRESFAECLSVLQSYRELLSGWAVAEANVKAIATSALRAARNRDVFVDRLRRETGFCFSIVEGIEETRLTYLAVRFALGDDLPQFWRANSMIIDVGGLSTEIMLLRRGKMVAAHSLNLGTIFIRQQSRLRDEREALPGPDTEGQGIEGRVIGENIKRTAEFLSAEMDLSYVRTLVASGANLRPVAARIGRELNGHCSVISREDFSAFAARVRNFSEDDCVRELSLTFGEAEGFVPGVLMYQVFLERTAAAQIVVPFVSIREGLLIDLSLGVDPLLREEFFSQVIASAVNLGRKYHFDESHHRHVAALSLSLFDALQREHGMDRRERLLLEVAAMLHDIGLYIRRSGHHKHGQYLVANSEIFGLHQEDLDLIGAVIRYHRGNPPRDYRSLEREARVLILKMTGLLRVADALDRSHSRRIRAITVERRGETLFLHAQGGGGHDLSLERLGLEEKADLFQEVFGYKVALD